MAPRPKDLATTLVRRARRRRREDERRLAGARTGVEAVLRACLDDRSVRRAWLIGSAALSEAAGVDVDVLRFEELDRGFQERVLAEGLEIGGP